MNRRSFAVALALVWPVAAYAQRSKPHRVGFLAGGARPSNLEPSLYGGFLRGMRELGYVEGKDYVVEWRFADGNYDRFPQLAAELVKLGVEVIVLGAMAAARPTQQVTSTTPIVMGFSVDPVANGLVQSLARPGGNITGLSSNYEETVPKTLELLRSMVPNVSRVAFFMNTANPFHMSIIQTVQRSGAEAGLNIVAMPIGSAQQIAEAFTAIKQAAIGALVVPADALFLIHRQRIAELALETRTPAVFANREYVLAGGLMSYGENLEDFYWRSARFVDRILNGTKASEIPVEQPVRFNVVVNRKTAAALGLIIPDNLFASADEMIE